MRRILKHHFEYLYNTEIQVKVAVHMYGFGGVQRGNYFGGELIRISEAEVRVRSLRMEIL